MTKRRQETIKFLTFDELKRLIVIANKRDRALFLSLDVLCPLATLPPWVLRGHSPDPSAGSFL